MKQLFLAGVVDASQLITIEKDPALGGGGMKFALEPGQNALDQTCRRFVPPLDQETHILTPHGPSNFILQKARHISASTMNGEESTPAIKIPCSTSDTEIKTLNILLLS